MVGSVAGGVIVRSAPCSVFGDSAVDVPSGSGSTSVLHGSVETVEGHGPSVAPAVVAIPC